jgi:hypothetical protein
VIDVMDSTLFVEDLKPALAAISKRLLFESDALEIAARGIGDKLEFQLKGCGGTGGPIVIQKAELQLAAGALRAASAAVDVFRAYGWRIRVSHVLQYGIVETQQFTNDLNATFLDVVDPSALESAKVSLREALDDLLGGIEAARAVRESDPSALIDWKGLPQERYDELLRVAQSVRDSFDRPTVVADVYPITTLDLGKLFSTPPEKRKLASPAWAIYGEDLRFVDGSVDAQLKPSLNPLPWPNQSSYRWNPEASWRSTNLDAVLHPGGPLRSVGCR